jgi:hypothetical protein
MLVPVFVSVFAPKAAPAKPRTNPSDSPDIFVRRPMVWIN